MRFWGIAPVTPFVFALFVLGLAGSARAEGLAGVEIPEDRSLSAEQYITRGLPDLESDWGPEQTARATRLLAELAAEDPSLLPRYGSDRSGDVFERVLAESLTFAELASEAPLASLQSYDFDPAEGVLFDRELLAIRRAIAEANLRVVLESAAAGREVDGWLLQAEREGSAASVDRLRGLGEGQDRIREAYGTRLLAAVEDLTSLCELEAASDGARSEARGHAERILREASPELSSEGGAVATTLRERLRASSGCQLPASAVP